MFPYLPLSTIKSAPGYRKTIDPNCTNLSVWGVCMCVFVTEKTKERGIEKLKTDRRTDTGRKDAQASSQRWTDSDRQINRYIRKAHQDRFSVSGELMIVVPKRGRNETDTKRSLN